MSWTLLFYRAVGQPVLTLADVDAFFAARPGVSRATSTDSDSRERAVFALGPVGSEHSLLCAFEPPDATTEEPGSIDFPYEETPLRLSLDYFEDDSRAAEAAALALDLCRELHLLCLDPQSEQELPLCPAPETLRESYAEVNQEVRDAIAFAVQRRRQFLIIALVLLAVGVLLFLAPALFRGS